MRAAWMVALSLAALGAQSGARAGTGIPEGIAWWQGEVQQAFDQAKREGRPLFLYWGAVWCPPCNQIKKTIFTRPDFVAKSRLFLPVYLDGDSERAQVWGDRLEVTGHADLGGTLAVSEQDGCSPTEAQQFQVLSYDSHSGAFDRVTSGYTAQYGDHAVTVQRSGAAPLAPALAPSTRYTESLSDPVPKAYSGTPSPVTSDSSHSEYTQPEAAER